MNFFNEMIFMCPCHTLSYNEVAISCTAAVRCILRLDLRVLLCGVYCYKGSEDAKIVRTVPSHFCVRIRSFCGAA